MTEELATGGTGGSLLPTVDVVIATHNRPHLLRAALDAALGQTYAGPIACTVVFDRSDPDLSLAQDACGDGTPERSVQVVTNVHSAGLAGARNTGIEAGQCRLRGVLRRRRRVAADQDRQADPAAPGVRATTPASPASGWSTRTVGSPGCPPPSRSSWRPWSATGPWRHTRRACSSAATPCVGPIGLVDEEIPGSYGEDFDWILRAVESGPISVVEESLVRVRWGQSLFSQKWQIIVDAIDYLIAKHPALSADRRGLARLLGRRSFALAALGRRKEALGSARRTIAQWPGERRAYLAIAVALRRDLCGAVDADCTPSGPWDLTARPPSRLTAAVVVVVSLAGRTCCPAARPDAGAQAGPPELVVNGDFEAGTDGWRTNQSYTKLVDRPRPRRWVGRHHHVAARHDRGTERQAEHRRPTRWRATATRSRPGYGRIAPELRGAIRVREVLGDSVRSAAKRFALTSTEWQFVDLGVTAQRSGSSFDLNVIGYDLAAGQQLIVDAVSMRFAGYDQAAAADPAAPVQVDAVQRRGAERSRASRRAGRCFGAAVGGNADPTEFESEIGQRLGIRRTYWGGDQVGGRGRDRPERPGGRPAALDQLQVAVRLGPDGRR